MITNSMLIFDFGAVLQGLRGYSQEWKPIDPVVNFENHIF